MNTFWHDLKFTARMMRRNPGFTLTALLSLSLGIGACTSIFSVVDAVLMRSLPYPESERIMELFENSDKGAQMRFTEPNYLDLRDRQRSFEAMAQYSGWTMTVTGGSEAVRTRVITVSNEFFRVMGTQPFAGRGLLPEEKGQATSPVAVVSYSFWQRLLGGRTTFNGTSLNIDDRSFAVIGVMPPGFNFPQNAEIWIPRELSPPQTSRTAHNWNVIGRLRHSTTLEQARGDVNAIGKQLKEEHGEQTDAAGLTLKSLQDSLVGDVRNVLLIVMVAVGFLLLVACTNVANLLLAQVTARQKEFAVRAALGASRLRLAKQSITENVLLALVAGVLAVVFSIWGVALLMGLMKNYMPRADEISVNGRVLMFTFGLSVLVAVILGLVPAVRFSSEDLQGGLKESGQSQSAHAASNRLRSSLVIAQVALTLILLTGAGLLGKSFYLLLQVDPGFQRESTVLMDLSLPQYREDEAHSRRLMQALLQLFEGKGNSEIQLPPAEDNPQEERTRMFQQQLLERLSQLPGVSAAGAVNSLPMTGTGASGTFLIDNNPTNRGYAEYRQASPGYFTTMGMKLLRGRLFEQNDKPNSPHVAVISQSLAQKQWPHEDPIGKRIQFGNMDGDLRLLHIVGVVSDIRDDGLDKNVSPTVYVSSFQRTPSSALSVVLRARIDPASLVTAMRQTVQSLNPDLPMNFRTLDQIFSASLSQRRFSLVIFGVFAAVALVLAMMGVYGVMTYAVSQRRQEIGIRMALGATVTDILKLMMKHGVKLIVPGLLIGLAGAFVLTRLMKNMLFNVSSTDPVTFIGTALLLVATALMACYLPARRASRVDPMIALRYQ